MIDCCQPERQPHLLSPATCQSRRHLHALVGPALDFGEAAARGFFSDWFWRPGGPLKSSQREVARQLIDALASIAAPPRYLSFPCPAMPLRPDPIPIYNPSLPHSTPLHFIWNWENLSHDIPPHCILEKTLLIQLSFLTSSSTDPPLLFCTPIPTSSRSSTGPHIIQPPSVRLQPQGCTMTLPFAF